VTNRAKYKEPCGCTSDDSQWIELCPEHFELRKNRLHEVKLDSMEWLMHHYDRFPNEDNFQHILTRFKELGVAVRSRPAIVKWILTHADEIKRRSTLPSG
jgi:phenylalanine-4-hydroxylase